MSSKNSMFRLDIPLYNQFVVCMYFILDVTILANFVRMERDGLREENNWYKVCNFAVGDLCVGYWNTNPKRGSSLSGSSK